jgi:hypothetical protein
MSKALIGPRLRARGFADQRTEAAIGVAVLNRMLAAGRPDSVRSQRVAHNTWGAWGQFAPLRQLHQRLSYSNRTHAPIPNPCNNATCARFVMTGGCQIAHVGIPGVHVTRSLCGISMPRRRPHAFPAVEWSTTSYALHGWTEMNRLLAMGPLEFARGGRRFSNKAGPGGVKAI